MLTTFLAPGGQGEGAYLWPGMQTFHYGFHLRRAGCLKKLGRPREAEAEVREAYRIIRTAWSDFQERPEHYMENFHDCLKEFDIEEYKE